MHAGRRLSLAIVVSLSVVYLSLRVSGEASGGEAVLGDAGPLVARDVSDCKEFREALAAGDGPTDVVVLTRRFPCAAADWPQEVRLEHNVQINGNKEGGVDWENVTGAIAMAPNTAMRVEEAFFMMDRLEQGALPGFLRLEDGAVVSFAGMVIGARCCGSESQCQVDGGESSGQGADRWDGGYVSDTSNADPETNSSAQMCNTLLECGAIDLQELKAARDAESEPTDASCGLDVLARIFGGGGDDAQPGPPPSGGSSSSSSGTAIWISVVILAMVGALLVVGLVMFRRIRRQRRMARLQHQVVKMGPVVSIPSMSSVAPSVGDKLIDSSCPKPQYFQEPAPQYYQEPKPQYSLEPKPQYFHESSTQEKSPKTGSGMDVSGIRLTIPIGKGAFSTVYKGSWGGMVVAVKIIKNHPDQKAVAPEKGQFEAELGFSIVHSNLVHTYGSQTKKCQDMTPRSSRPSCTTIGEDIVRGQSRVTSEGSIDCFSDMAEALAKGPGRDDYETWIVMEYCDKGSLQGAIRRGSFFEDPERARPRLADILLTALDVAKGMERLHAMSIVHGDLKPRNVLLRTKKVDVRGYNCKVGDFGFSRYIPDSHITTTSCGAVNYMPPELLAEGTLTPAADVYSFGILLWELVVGKDPYPSKCHNDIIVLVTSGSRPKVPDRLPSEISELLQSCWHQAHEARPTFSEIVTTLKEMLANPKLGASRPQGKVGQTGSEEARSEQSRSEQSRSEQSRSEQAKGSKNRRNPLQDLMTFSFDTNSRAPSSSASMLSSQDPSPSAPRSVLSSQECPASVPSSVPSSLGLPPQAPTSVRPSSPAPTMPQSATVSSFSTGPLTGRSVVDPLRPVQDLPPTPLDIQDGSQMNGVQDFPPTLQDVHDVQNGSKVARVTSKNMKSLFLKELHTGKAPLSEIDDLLATVNIGQKPRIPKSGLRKKDILDQPLQPMRQSPLEDNV